MPAFDNGIQFAAEPRSELGDGESIYERNPLGERVHHGDRGLSNSQTKHATVKLWQMLLYCLIWIDSVQRGSQDTHDTGVVQTMCREMIVIHFCYHNRNSAAEDGCRNQRYLLHA